MTAVICDTSALFAFFNDRDPQHLACVTAVNDHREEFIVSPLVVAELDHLVRNRGSGAAARAVLSELASRSFTIVELSVADLSSCVDLDERYSDLGLGITDCHLVVLAAAHGTTRLLSLDERHFRAVKPLAHGRAFRLLPADR